VAGRAPTREKVNGVESPNHECSPLFSV
jgi:hypothetical protein